MAENETNERPRRRGRRSHNVPADHPDAFVSNHGDVPRPKVAQAILAAVAVT